MQESTFMGPEGAPSRRPGVLAPSGPLRYQQLESLDPSAEKRAFAARAEAAFLAAVLLGVAAAVAYVLAPGAFWQGGFAHSDTAAPSGGAASTDQPAGATQIQVGSSQEFAAGPARSPVGSKVWKNASTAGKEEAARPARSPACPNEGVCGCRESVPVLHRPSCGFPEELSLPSTTPSEIQPCLNPELGHGKDTWKDLQCHVSYKSPSKAPRLQVLQHLSKTCLSPDRGELGAKNAMFLLGDSHAGMLLEGLKSRFGGSNGFSVRYFGVSGSWCCGFCSLDAYSYTFQAGWLSGADQGVKKDARERCDNYARVVMDSLRSVLRPGDIVVVSNFDHWDSSGLDGELSALGTRISELHTIVNWQGAALVLVGPSPKLPTVSEECVPTEVCDVGLSGHRATKQLYARLENDLDGLLFFDIQKLLCDDSHCGVMIPGTQVSAYLDQHHVSRVASHYLAQFLCSDLSRAGLLPKGLK